ncbi:MAG: SDR family NAD(P)-dependent oxidoreductase [Bacteroidota bacterium]
MKNILISGANSVIGKQIIELLSSDTNFITLSRSELEGSDNHYITDIEKNILPDIDMALDGLVYCPGTINLKPFRNLKPEDFREDFEINLIGAVKVINKYINNLLKSQSASVVLFSSVAAGSGMPFHASIASSKAAVEGLSRSLAAEFAGRIRFNVIAPSLTDTPLAERLLRTDSQREASAAKHPMKRIGMPVDIAGAVSFLLSDESSWMTGQVLKVDGGLSTLITK